VKSEARRAQPEAGLYIPIFSQPAPFNFEEQRSLPRETCPFFCLTGADLTGALSAISACPMKSLLHLFHRGGENSSSN
jgi:hypothetical protein